MIQFSPLAQLTKHRDSGEEKSGSGTAAGHRETFHDLQGPVSILTSGRWRPLSGFWVDGPEANELF